MCLLTLFLYDTRVPGLMLEVYISSQISKLALRNYI